METHTPEKANKIITFLHFHKAGGTSMNNLFSNYNKYKFNFNGNPWTTEQPFGPDSYAIPFFNYKKDELDTFIKNLQSNHVQFIAMEWNFFKHYNDVPYKCLELITCMRNPYERFKSRMLLEKMTNYEDFVKINFVTPDGVLPATFNKFNYYVRMLSGHGDEPDLSVDENLFQTAIHNLDKFETIVLLDYPETFKSLLKYNVDISSLNSKLNANMEKDFYSINIDELEFKNLNKYDYMLFDCIKTKLQVQ